MPRGDSSCHPEFTLCLHILYILNSTDFDQAIGAAQDAARMEKVVNFYAKLPRGSAPETKPAGIVGWYQRRFFSSGSAGRKYCPNAFHLAKVAC